MCKIYSMPIRTEMSIADLILCRKKWWMSQGAPRGLNPAMSVESYVFYKTMVAFIKETQGNGHIMKLMALYDKYRKMYGDDIHEWKYRKSRQELLNFIKTFSIRKERPDMLDEERMVDMVLCHYQQVDVEPNGIYLTEYNGEQPKLESDIELDPIYDVKAYNLLKLYPQYNVVYITVWQLYGKPIVLFKTKDKLKSFMDNVAMPTFEPKSEEEARANINPLCFYCGVKKNCEKYIKYQEGMATAKDDLLSLLLKRSALNGQRIELSDVVWKLTQVIKSKVEEQGEAIQDGMRFYLEQKQEHTWDWKEVKDILEKENLWRDDILDVNSKVLNKIIEKNPDLIVKLQRAVTGTDTEMKLKGNAEWMKGKTLLKNI